MATDVEAVVYLMLQNAMLHDLFPSVVTIGEDVSGMPTFCRCSTLLEYLGLLQIHAARLITGRSRARCLVQVLK